MENDIYKRAEIELLNLLTRPQGPVPTSTSEPEKYNKETNISYSRTIIKNSEIKDSKQKIKILEDKVRDLTQENIKS